jgi:hypothetical protein
LPGRPTNTAATVSQRRFGFGKGIVDAKCPSLKVHQALLGYFLGVKGSINNLKYRYLFVSLILYRIKSDPTHFRKKKGKRLIRFKKIGQKTTTLKYRVKSVLDIKVGVQTKLPLSLFSLSQMQPIYVL